MSSSTSDIENKCGLFLILWQSSIIQTHFLRLSSHSTSLISHLAISLLLVLNFHLISPIHPALAKPFPSYPSSSLLYIKSIGSHSHTSRSFVWLHESLNRALRLRVWISQAWDTLAMRRYPMVLLEMESIRRGRRDDARLEVSKSLEGA